MSKNKQEDFYENQAHATPAGPVECLGQTFENDTARRDHFLGLLCEKLKDPEFRKIEGFPIGEDEDILALSDPPYYTACPNPWIADFIAQWEAQKPPKPEGYHYHREPFAADVSEGKNDPIYNAHSYHTKVPHKAIMRYILHYTEPGDIVFDGFCGTGMTGVAAQLCGDRDMVMSLGYQVTPDGDILQEEVKHDTTTAWTPFSKLGARRIALNDLSPAATLIAYSYNTPVDVATFQDDARDILHAVDKELGWMYETVHTDGRIGRINYTVWSDVFVCSECAEEIVFWDIAVDKVKGEIRETFQCPSCKADLQKRNLPRAFRTKFDPSTNSPSRQSMRLPVLINYSVDGNRFEKVPDLKDLALIERIEASNIPYPFPTARMMDGKESRRNDPAGLTHVHHFFAKRSLSVLASLYFKARNSVLMSVVLDGFPVGTSMSRFRVPAWIDKSTGPMKGWTSGTLYLPSLQGEQSWLNIFKEKSSMVARALRLCNLKFANRGPISTSSLENFFAPDGTIDYVFLDPPFGSNLSYSELNFIVEAWGGVFTNIDPEAIENSAHGKSPDVYRQRMTACFHEAYRVLKPGRWMTVEFSNTKASVWNNIQVAIAEAGFIVANVSVLDKKQGSFKAVTTPTAVKQDLVISAYKPNGGFEERFQREAQSEEGVWDFVRTHLRYLPVTKQQGALLQFVPERDPRILFDQMVAYYVRKGYPVPVSSLEFQSGLAERFSERDGMFFLPEQAAEYDRKKIVSGELTQMTLFVSDEASAIQWLRQLIKEKPQTSSDINPQFMKQLGGWNKNEAQLDLRELLDQNFLCYDGKGPVPEQIHAYLSSNWKELRNLAKDAPALIAKAKDRWYVPDPNKAGDLEKLREKALLKEFWSYLPPGCQPLKADAQKDFIPGLEPAVGPVPRGKKMKVIRLEAVRAGFKHCWQSRDYRTIIAVAQRIPENVLQEDPKLLMWYDQALTRSEG